MVLNKGDLFLVVVVIFKYTKNTLIFKNYEVCLVAY